MGGLKQVKIKDKARLILELNLLTPQLKELSRKVHNIQKQIELIEIKEKKRGLILTDHAIDRFRERIGYGTEEFIRKNLITEELLNKYVSYNQSEVRISHPSIPNCDCVIIDSKIITIINTFDPYKELERLGYYMKYYINCLCKNIVPNSFTVWQANNIGALKKKS